MDPEATLLELRELAAELVRAADSAPGSAERLTAPDKAWRLAELVQAMDGWITGGGFRPADWDRPL